MYINVIHRKKYTKKIHRNLGFEICILIFMLCEKYYFVIYL